MDSFEEFYGNRERRSDAKSDSEFIAKYNKQVDLAIPLIKELLAYYKLHPPKVYSWAVIDGQKYVKWEIGSREGAKDSYGYGDTNIIYLLSNGNFFHGYSDVILARHIRSVKEINTKFLFDQYDYYDALRCATSGLANTLKLIKNPPSPKVQTNTKKGFFSKLFG